MHVYMCVRVRAYCMCGCVGVHVYVCGGSVCLNTNVGFNALYTCNVCCVGCNGCHV